MALIEVPVLVAGGGPVGLMTALELQSRGVRTLVVERNPSITGHPKMDVTNHRSMEHFRRLGIAERIRNAGVARENCMDVAWRGNVVPENALALIDQIRGA